MKVFIVLLCCFHLYNSADTAKWTYNEPWAEKCATGLAQSPIDIDLSNVQNLMCMDSFQIQIVPNLGDVQVHNDYKGLGILTGGDYSTLNIKFPGRSAAISFQSLQFHIHVKSQHEIFGQQYDIEVHFVHSTSDTTIERSLAVIGFLFQQQDDADVKETTFFDVWQFQTAENVKYNWDGGQALENLVKQSNVYVNYDGSLTTPGCAQLVNWFVSTKIRKIKKSHLTKIKEILSKIDGVNSIDGTNHRPVQQLNDRKINLLGLECNLLRELTKNGLNQHGNQITTVVNINNSPLYQAVLIIVLLFFVN